MFTSLEKRTHRNAVVTLPIVSKHVELSVAEHLDLFFSQDPAEGLCELGLVLRTFRSSDT